MAKRSTPGTIEPGIHTASWNEFCETTQKVNQLPPNTSRPANASGASRLVVGAYNATAAAITADFPILAINGPLYNAEDDAEAVWRNIQVNGATPGSDTTIADIVIVQGPIADEAIAPAVLRGLTSCKLEVNDLAHEFAIPISGDNTKLETNATTGAKIIWKGTPLDSLPEEVDAIIMLEGARTNESHLRWGEVSTAITAAAGWAEADWGTGAVQFKDAAGANDGSPVTVDNPFNALFSLDYVVCVDQSFSPPRVVSGSCEAMTEST